MAVWHTLWQQSLGWTGPPVRLSLLALLLLLLVTRAGPFALRLVGRALQEHSAGCLLLLTYPEYLLTTRARRDGRSPSPRTFAYGSYLGVLEGRLHAIGGWLTRFGGYSPALPWRYVFVALVAVTAFWYVGADLSNSRGAQLPVQNELTGFDSWLLTGHWSPTATPDEACT